MKYYKINPEVPASYGEETIFNTSVIPIEIIKLHLVFEGWLGSDIMTISPVFFVTKILADKIEFFSFTGLKCIENVKVEKSENFREIYPDKEVPSCKLLRINGSPYSDDFGIKNGSLIISEKVKDLLNQFNLTDVSFEDTSAI